MTDRIEEVKEILIDNLLMPCAGQGIAVYEHTANKIAPEICQLFPQPLIEPKPPDCICCEYMRKCSGDPQKPSYCPDPKYSLWLMSSIPQPVDDKELRDEAIEILGREHYGLQWEGIKRGKDPTVSANEAYDWVEGTIDKILALLQPKIEEAEKRGIDTAIKAYESTCESLIVEAVKRERERIRGWGNEWCEAHRSIKRDCEQGIIRKHQCWECWQALKKGGE